MRSYGLRAKINTASYENASGIAEQVICNTLRPLVLFVLLNIWWVKLFKYKNLKML